MAPSSSPSASKRDSRKAVSGERGWGFWCGGGDVDGVV